MKLQIQHPAPPLEEDIRKAKTFRTPQNLLLKILIFAGVFLAIELIEGIAAVGGLMPRYLSWASEYMAETGSNITTEVANDQLNNMLKDPANTVIVLFRTAAGTIAAMLFCRTVEGRKFRTMGFYKKGAVLQYIIGLFTGFAAFSMIVGVAWLLGGVKFEAYLGNITGNFMLLLLAFGIQGMSEEVICRGFMMTSTMRHYDFWVGVLVNSVVFSLAHVKNPGFTVLTFVNLILAGITLSLYMLRTGNIWASCAFHTMWNFSQGNFYGLPVSGIDTGDSIFRMSLSGSKLINGGDFGLESGLGCTVVSILWILALLFVPNPFAKKKQEESA